MSHTFNGQVGWEETPRSATKAFTASTKEFEMKGFALTVKSR